MEVLSETLDFTRSNITKTLTNEVMNLRNVIHEELTVKLRNLTNDLNFLKEKQNSLTDLGDERDQNLDTLWAYFDGNMTVSYLNKNQISSES